MQLAISWNPPLDISSAVLLSVPQAQWLMRYLSYHLQTERELNKTRLEIMYFSRSLIGLIVHNTVNTARC